MIPAIKVSTSEARTYLGQVNMHLRGIPSMFRPGVESHLRVQHAALADAAQPVAIAQALEAEAGAGVRAA